MSVIIKGMDMPESCRDCKLVDSEYCTCVPMGFYNDDYYVGNYDKERAPFCPLVEMPTPHGKLIDADKMIEALVERFCGAEATIIDLETRYVNLFVITNLLKQAPAEIEAEEV